MHGFRWPTASLRAYLVLVILVATVPLALFSFHLVSQQAERARQQTAAEPGVLGGERVPPARGRANAEGAWQPADAAPPSVSRDENAPASATVAGCARERIPAQPM